MKLQTAITAALFGAFAINAQAYDQWDWPTHYKFDNGVDVGISANYAGDYNSWSGISDLTSAQQATMEDSHGARREEFNVFVKKAGVFDAIWGWDYWNKSYLDVFLRLESKAFLGDDYGKFRFGYSKTWVGFESVTASRNDSFLETAMVEQAFFEGRRTGVDWEFEAPAYRFDVGAYGGQDLQGDNDGTTVAGRVAWTPFKAAGDVLHLGISASEENPDSSVINGKGQEVFPSTRPRARPDAFLTSTRFVDTGAITNVDSIDRVGLEGLWIHGPWSVQGEWINEDVNRFGGKPDYSGTGGYIFGSWVVTGESRPYSAGNVGNLKPKGDWGALELLARYDTLDLNDNHSGILGGKENNWTLGANWYILTHFRVQANYVLAHVESPKFNGGKSFDPKIFELRAQIYF